MFFRDGFNDWVILVNKYLYFDMINFFILIGWLVYYLLLGYFRSSVFLDKFYFVLFNFFWENVFVISCIILNLFVLKE